MPSRLKVNARGQFSNKHRAFKAAVRRLVPCGPADDVLELFCGEGFMYADAWFKAGAGACMDNQTAAVDRAAWQRARWTVLQVGVEKALRFGVWRERAFSIVDIDCYGSPWKFLAQLFFRPRALAPVCHLILTDHYMAHRNISKEDATLLFRKPGSPEQYVRSVEALLEKLLPSLHYRWEHRFYRQEKMVQHVIRLERANDAGETLGQ